MRSKVFVLNVGPRARRAWALRKGSPGAELLRSQILVEIAKTASASEFSSNTQPEYSALSQYSLGLASAKRADRMPDEIAVLARGDPLCLGPGRGVLAIENTGIKRILSFSLFRL